MDAPHTWTIHDLYLGVRASDAVPSKEDTIRLVGDLEAHWCSVPSGPMEMGLWMFLRFGVTSSVSHSCSLELRKEKEAFRCARLKTYCVHHDLQDEVEIMQRVQTNIRRMAVVMHQMLIVHAIASSNEYHPFAIKDFDAIADLLRLQHL